MGTIDKTTHKLSCEDCGITEDASVLDKGSGWGGSHWQSGTSFENFSTTWSGGGKEEPVIVEAKCKSCGQIVKSNPRYSG